MLDNVSKPTNNEYVVDNDCLLYVSRIERCGVYCSADCQNVAVVSVLQNCCYNKMVLLYETLPRLPFYVVTLTRRYCCSGVCYSTECYVVGSERYYIRYVFV